MRQPPQLGAEASVLAGEGDESLERAVGAPQAREAVSQQTTGEEVSELLFYELRQWWSVGVTLGSFEKGPEVCVDHAVQHGVLGVARSVVRSAEGHTT
jgi:hypothetical protein